MKLQIQTPLGDIEEVEVDPGNSILDLKVCNVTVGRLVMISDPKNCCGSTGD